LTDQQSRTEIQHQSKNQNTLVEGKCKQVFNNSLGEPLLVSTRSS